MHFLNDKIIPFKCVSVEIKTKDTFRSSRLILPANELLDRKENEKKEIKFQKEYKILIFKKS